MEKISEKDLSLFDNPFRILIAGASNSGKSFFASELIRRYYLKFTKIIVIGSDLENIDDLNIERNDDFNPFDELESLIGETLVVFDDVIFNENIIKIASQCFIRGRHLRISCIFLSQNLFLNNKYFRIISLNCTHVVLFQMRDSKQIKYFAKSFLSDGKIEPFSKLYRKEVLNKDYNYLFIDFTKHPNSKLQIRNNIFNIGSFEKIYIL